jgi:hypothetical protein
MMTFAAPYKNWRALYRVLGSRYREVSLLANARYLNALAVVDDPTEAKRDLDRVTTCKKDAAGRPCAGFNPMARHDSDLFRAVIDGEHWLKGFTNRDIRRKLEAAPLFKTWDKDPKKQSSKVSRILRKFHAHGLIVKISRTRRWKVTAYGIATICRVLIVIHSAVHQLTNESAEVQAMPDRYGPGQVPQLLRGKVERMAIDDNPLALSEGKFKPMSVNEVQ